MNARDSLLVALPAVVIGLGLGYLFGSVFGDAPAEIEAVSRGGRTEALAPSTPPPADAAPLVQPSTQSLRRTPEVRTAEVAHVSQAQVDRAIERARSPEVAALRGPGAITGTIVDEHGAPLAGALVTASMRATSVNTTDPTRVGSGPPIEKNLEAYLREQAKSWAKRRAQRQRATTGADGAYRLDALRDDTGYGVTAYLEGYVIEPNRRAYEVTAGEALSFRARRVHEVPFAVVHDDGSEPLEAAIQVVRGNDTALYSWSPEQRNLRLTAGRVRVKGFSGLRDSSGYRSGVDSSHGSDEVSLDVLENAGAVVQLVLEPRGVVRGSVRDPWGDGDVSSLEVKALLLPPDRRVDEKALAESNQSVRLRGARYALLDLSAGTYAIGLTNRGDKLLMHEVVDVNGATVDLDLEVPEPNANEHLVVRAYEPSGRPLDDVSFSFRYESSSGSSSGGIQARRGPDGAYWIQPGGRYSGYFNSWPEGTSYTLTVKHSELGNREIELENDQRELEVHFVEPVSIVVLVTGHIGSGYEGKLTVTVQRVNEDGDVGDRNSYYGGRGRNDGKLSADGKTRFDGLEPGTWKVVLRSGNRWGNNEVATSEVQAHSGEYMVTLEMPALYELIVYAPGLAQDTWLFLTSAAGEEEGEVFGWGGGPNATLDEDHRGEFTGLIAGLYVLNANGLTDRVEVTVPCGEFYLDASEPTCMRVAIGDVEGALYASGMRAGDLIIGANGKEFVRAIELWTILQEAKTDFTPLMVLRNGEQIEISLPKIPMGPNWYQDLGGMLTPASRE